MSKLYIYSICISISGIVLSFIILLHEANVINAGSAAYCSSCVKTAGSPYAFIAGIPVAAAGIAWFLMLLLVAVYMFYKDDDTIKKSGAFVLVMLGCCGIVFDILMGSMMVVYRVFCPLCIATYLANIFIVIISLLLLRFYKFTVRAQGISTGLIAGLTRIPRVERILLVIILLMIIPLTYTINSIVKPAKQEAVNGNTRNFVNSIYEKPVITEKFPDSAMIISEGTPVNIAVFTDFNCSSCKRLFEILKSLSVKYPGKIKVSLYNFPLDKKCNNSLDSEYYPDSCDRAINNTAFASTGGFKGVTLDNDYRNYKPESGVRKQAESVVKRDIELYKKLNLTAVPAIIINGRVIEGNPGKDVIEAVVTKEIKDAQSNGK